MIKESGFRNEVLDFFIQNAPRMGDIALKHFRHLNSYNIANKPGHINDPITIADMEISDFILSAIKKEFGQKVSILTEESDFDHDSFLNSKRPLIISDELDGTRNFKENKDDFSHLLGLAENIQGSYIMTVGLIYKPLTGEFYFATIDTDSKRKTSGVEEKISVSNISSMIENRTPVNVAIGRETFPKDYSEDYYKVTDVMESFQKANKNQVRKNSRYSCGLEIIDIAKGNVTAYLIAKAANWDYASASLILRQAGGHSYIVKSIGDLITPRPWSLQLEAPKDYYPALFTNGAIDKSLFEYIRNKSLPQSNKI